MRKKSQATGDVKKGSWTAHEDKILYDYITSHGTGKWRALPIKAGLNRCGKSCRLRWLNYLRPEIKRGNITEEEEDLIIRLHNLLGNRWSLIAGRIPGRTDNEIKNYWNTCLRKKFTSKTLPSQPDTSTKSNNSTPTTFHRSAEVTCIKVCDTERSSNCKTDSPSIMHGNTQFDPLGGEFRNLGPLELMQSPCLNAGSFNIDGNSYPRTCNNGEMPKEESIYPVLGRNNLWDPFSY